MTQSHAIGRASQPTSAQLKEFFAQIDAGKITKARLQAFLRDESTTIVEVQESLECWMRKKGFIAADHGGRVWNVGKEYDVGSWVGFLIPQPDNIHFPGGRKWPIGRFLRPFVATLSTSREGNPWELKVFGTEHGLKFQELAKELEKIYGVKVEVEIARTSSKKESIATPGY